MKGLTKYRMITLAMDITRPFASQVDALREAEARAAYHPVQLFVMANGGEWRLIFDREKGGNV